MPNGHSIEIVLDAVRWFLFAWLGAGLFIAVAYFVRRTLAVVAHAALVEMVGLALAKKRMGLDVNHNRFSRNIRLMKIYQLLSQKGQSMTENMFVKAQECTESMDHRSFEKESIASALADWVRASFMAISSTEARRYFTDDLTLLIRSNQNNGDTDVSSEIKEVEDPPYTS